MTGKNFFWLQDHYGKPVDRIAPELDDLASRLEAAIQARRAETRTERPRMPAPAIVD